MRTATFFLLFLFLTVCCIEVASAQTVTITASADAYVRDGSHANSNFGSESELYVKNDRYSGNSREAFFKFDLSSYPQIESATFRIYPAIVGDPGQVHRATLVSDDSWEENTITWNNKPSSSGQLGSDFTVVAGQAIEINVTAAAIQAASSDGLLSIRVVKVGQGGGGDVVAYASRENGDSGIAPSLIIEESTPPPNIPPIAQNDSTNTIENLPVTIDVLENDSDPDGTLDPTSVMVVADPANGSTSVDPSTGEVTYTPAPGFVGSDSFTYTVADDSAAVSNEATVTVTVNPEANELPQFTSTPVTDAIEGEPYSYVVTAVDAELDAITLTAPTIPSWLSFTDNLDGSGLLEGTPGSEDVGDHTVVLRATDRPDDYAFQNFVITVNPAGDFDTLAGPSSIVASADAYVRGGTYANTNFGSETELFVKNDKTANNTREAFFKFNLSSVSQIGSAKVRLYPVGIGDPGQVHRALLVTNDSWQENTITWNNKPSSSSQLGSDFTVVAGQAVEIDVTAAAQQAASTDDLLSIRVVKVTQGGGGDVVTYASREHATAAFRPVLIIDDGGGGPPNNPPVAQNDNATTTEGVQVVIPVLNNDSDSDGTLVPSTVTVVDQADHGSTTVNPTTGAITYTPAAGFTGSDSFTYTVRDDDGAVSNQATVSVQVNPASGGSQIVASADAYVRGGTYANTNFGSETELFVKNDKTANNTREAFFKFNLSSVSQIGSAKVRLYPVGIGDPGQVHRALLVTNDSWQENTITWNNKPSSSSQLGSDFTVVAGQAVEIDVTAAAQQAASTDDLLSIRVVKVTQGGGGDVVTYASREHATAAFRPVLIIDDGGGGPPNNPPVAQNDNATTTEGVQVVIPVLNNDSDSDGTLVPSTVTVVDQADHGSTTVNPTTGAITYTPAAGFTGSDSFTYTVRDDDGAVSNQATVSVQVNPASGGGGEIVASADAYVRGGTHANTNFGTSEELYVKNDKIADNTREVFLKFNLSSVPQIGNAKLRLYPIYVGNPGQVHRATLVTNDSWQENTITWNNKPASSTQVTANWTVVSGQYIELDVTVAAVQAKQGDGVLSLHIAKTTQGGASDAVIYASRQHSNPAYRPKLIISDTPSFAVDDIFIIAGQSNAQGIGDQSLSPDPPPGTAFEYIPGTDTFVPLDDPVGNASTGSAWPAFAKKWYELTGRTSAFVATAVGGTPNSRLINATNNWENGVLLDNAIAAGHQLNARTGAQADVAVLWVQGERDGKAIQENLPRNFSKADYKAAFKTTIATFRNQGWKNFRLVLSEIGTNTILGDVGYADVRAAQAEIVAEGEPGVVTGFNQAITFPARGMMANDGTGLHYTQAGYNEMGTAMAVALAASRGYSAAVVSSGDITPETTLAGKAATAEVPGDVSGDGVLTAEDATLLLHGVGKGSLAAGSDVSGDGRLTVYDAALIKQYKLGLIDCLPVQEGCLDKTQKADNPSATLDIGEYAREGDLIRLPVTLSSVKGSVTALQLGLRFDSTIVRVSDVVTDLPEGWEMATTIREGNLYVGLMGTTPISSGNVATLVLEPLADESAIEIQGEGFYNEEASQTLFWSGDEIIPTTFTLQPNYPNPFNSETQIVYQLAEPADVKLEVFNTLGQRVASLVHASQDAGKYTVVWNGQSDAGSSVSSGLYICRIQAGSYVETIRMLLVK